MKDVTKMAWLSLLVWYFKTGTISITRFKNDITMMVAVADTHLKIITGGYSKIRIRQFLLWVNRLDAILDWMYSRVTLLSSFKKPFNHKGRRNWLILYRSQSIQENLPKMFSTSRCRIHRWKLLLWNRRMFNNISSSRSNKNSWKKEKFKLNLIST